MAALRLEMPQKVCGKRPWEHGQDARAPRGGQFFDREEPSSAVSLCLKEPLLNPDFEYLADVYLEHRPAWREKDDRAEQENFGV